MIVTDDDRIAEMCRSLRNQGRPMGWRPPTAHPETRPEPRPDGRPENSTGGTATGSWLRHERLGYNYRLSEINAALGVVQMDRFEELAAKRQRVARMYMERLSGHNDLVLPTIEADSVNTWFVFVVRLAPTYTIEERDRIIRGLRNHDIGASDYFPCIHLQSFYREQFGFRQGQFPIAESVSNRTIALPFHNDLTESDVEVVCQTLELMISRENLRKRS